MTQPTKLDQVAQITIKIWSLDQVLVNLVFLCEKSS